MEIITNQLDFVLDEKNNAITVGKFDGIHLGHRKIMQKLKELAKRDGGKSVVVSFDTSPYKRLQNKSALSIYSRDERIMLLEEIGIDYLVEYPFSDEVMCMSPGEFVTKLLVNNLHASSIVVGEDFRFGYKRAGDVCVLQELSQEYGFTAVAMKKETYEDGVISSTVVRENLRMGNIVLANRLLGKPFFVTGLVLHGKKLGRSLGMPTINQIVEDDKLLPPFGVYATKTVVDGICYKSVTNIGIRPTVTSVGEVNHITVETNLLGYEGDLYGQTLTVSFTDFLRPEQKFENLNELSRQMHMDRENAKNR